MPFGVAIAGRSSGAGEESEEETSAFTPDHIAKCPARKKTCKFCQKTSHYERTCRGRRAAGRGCVGLIYKGGTEGEHIPRTGG